MLIFFSMQSKHGSRATKSRKTAFAKREYDTGQESAAFSARKSHLLHINHDPGG